MNDLPPPTPTPHEALRADVARRIGAVQRLMADHGLGALLGVGDGSPNGTAAARYLANGRAWAGPLHVVLAARDPDPWLLSYSTYQAQWSRDATTTRPERVEAPADVMARVADLVAGLAGAQGRVGVVGLGRMTVADLAALRARLPAAEFVDATAPFDALRRIKSPFELEALRENGRLLSLAMADFAAAARPGTSYAAACAQAETRLKAAGAFWGRSKVSFGESPVTVPLPPERLVTRGDAFTFELVYESPLGYWTEMTTQFAVGDVPDSFARLFEAYWAAFEAARGVARPGLTLGDVAAAADAALRDRGYAPVGKHTPDGHSIGLDGSDGPSALADPGFRLAQDMVLSMHPGAALAGERALLVSDNVRVTPEGGERLSPHGRGQRLVVLDG